MIAKGIGSIFGPLAALRAQYIGKMIDRVINTMVRMSTWLGRTILSGIRFGMAYRDYRNFTGRSTSSLGGLMGRTFNTQNMRPEDVLRDAAALETQYWDMILGGGNPAFYQLLGLHPTGTGEIDLQNIISSIGAVTGNFSHRSLARALLKMGGLSEEYLNMVLDRNSGNVDVNAILASTEQYEQANKAVKQFEWELLRIKGELAKAFVESGFLGKLKEIFLNLNQYMPEIISGIKRVFNALVKLADWLEETFFGPSEFDKAAERIRKREEEDRKLGVPSWITALGNITTPSDWLPLLFSSPSSSNRTLTMSNNYYVNSPEDAARTSAGVMNAANTVADRWGYNWQKQANDTMMEYSKP